MQWSLLVFFFILSYNVFKLLVYRVPLAGTSVAIIKFYKLKEDREKMSIQLCIVILYIILLFAISFYVKRRASQNPTQYLFAGRQFSTGLVAVSITGMAVGAASTVGVAESATKIGLAAGWYNAAWAIGAIVMGFVAAGKYRSLNCTTIPELFERSYDKKPA